MSFGGLLFTNLGKNLQAKSMTGSELRFTKIVIGDGELGSGSILDLRNVVHEIKSLEITKLKSTPDGKAILGTKFDNDTISVGFYWREIGVFAMDPDIGEILYCYGNAGTNADYIPASGGAQVIEKVIDLPIIIGNATNVTASIASGVYVLVEDFENKTDILDAEINALKEQNNNLGAYAVASGTNTYTATIAGITALTEGFSIKIKFTNTNTGTSTLNINGLGAKSILKGNGSTLSSGNIKAGQICNLVYNGLNFQLLGEGGEYGTATSSDVLSGKTIGTDNGLVAGTIPSKAAATITPSTIAQTIAAGQYLSGIQTIIGDADLISANIKSGANIFGVEGNSNVVDTSTGTASASHILSAYKAYVDGALLIGTMPNNGAQSATITTQSGTKAIPAGYTTGGIVTVSISNLSAGNIKSGVNVGGVVGELIPASEVSGTFVAGSESINYYTFITNKIVMNLGLDFIPSMVVLSQIEARQNNTYYCIKAGTPSSQGSGVSIKPFGGSNTYAYTVNTINPIYGGFEILFGSTVSANKAYFIYDTKWSVVK